jgi:hypothetical protein
MRFSSVFHSEKFGYEYVDFSSLEFRSNEAYAFNRSFRVYDTLGDGNTQHSPSTPIRPELLYDFLASLLRHLTEQFQLMAQGRLNREEFFRLVDRRLHSDLSSDRHGNEVLEFASTVVWQSKQDDAGNVHVKRRWYSLDERKITSSASKIHDRRYLEVEEWQTGTPQAMLGTIMRFREYASQWERFVLAVQIQEWAARRQEWTPNLIEFLGWDKQMQVEPLGYWDAHSLKLVYETLRDFCQAFRMIAYAERYAKSVTESAAERKQKQEVAAASVPTENL